MTTQTQHMMIAMRSDVDKQMKWLSKKIDAIYLIRWMLQGILMSKVPFRLLYNAWEIESALFGLDLPTQEDCIKAFLSGPFSEQKFIEFFTNHFKISG